MGCIQEKNTLPVGSPNYSGIAEMAINKKHVLMIFTEMILHPRNPTWNCMLFLRSPNMNLWCGLKWICSPGNHATNFFNKITQKLTWNPMQAQTEPKLHPETANLEVEQVVPKRFANLKGDLQVNLEPKLSLRCSP